MGHARVELGIVAGALSVLTGCVGNAGPAPTAMLPQAATRAPQTRPLAGKHVVYVSDEGVNAVFVYPAGVNDPSPSAEITDGIADPLGIAIDPNGTLYVANFAGGASGSGSISEYTAGAVHPSLTITDVNKPNSVAVDTHGNLYVGENTATTVEIAEFAPGATSPMKTVFPTQVPGIPFMGGMATDKAGNLYAAFFIYFKPPAHVVKLSPGLTQQRDLNLRGLDSLDFNPGLARDGAGNLYVATLPAVNVYGKHSPKVTRKIETSTAQYVAATANGTLYVPDQTEVQVYAPGASSPEATITNSLVLPEGVATR